MKVENHTPFPMRASRDHPAHDLARFDSFTMVTWEFTLEGSLSRSIPQIEWPRISSPADLGYVQLFVSGAIRAQDGKTFTSCDASLSVGEARREIRAFGPRRWRRSGGKLAASLPAPVEQVPMVWANAYGGSFNRPPGIVRGTGVPGPSTVESCAFNPGGCGFYVTEAEAEGGLLPSLESPSTLVGSWDDRPEPHCWEALPPSSSLRLSHIVEREGLLSTRGQPGRSPLLDLEVDAPPWLRFPDLGVGSKIELEGFAARPLTFEIPPAPFAWRLSNGSRERWTLPRLWSVVLLPDELLVATFYRSSGLIPLVRREPRVAAQVTV